MTTSLLLIGAGKMGGAMLTGWLANGAAPGGVTVVEPNRHAREVWADQPEVNCYAAVDRIAEKYRPTMVVLAVKPQTMAGALPALRRFVAPGTAFLSIAAGTTLAVFQHHLGDQAAIIRAMPNTPAAVGRGISAYFGNAAASDVQKSLAARLLGGVGEVVELDDESQMDAVTAVSGSGPAYVFHLIEALAEAGVAAGLPTNLSMQLARATVSGAGELASQSGEDASELRINVTSPGGTTQAALEILMDKETGLPPLMSRAVAAAKERAIALAE